MDRTTTLDVSYIFPVNLVSIHSSSDVFLTRIVCHTAHLGRKFDSALAEVDLAIERFNHLTMDLHDSLENASDADKRSE